MFFNIFFDLSVLFIHCFLNFVHRSISIMKVAQAKLKEIGPDDMNMDEYKVRSSLYIYRANI